MSVKQPTIINFVSGLPMTGANIADLPPNDQTMVLVTWGPMTAGDTCAPASLSHWADRSVEMQGTWSNSATVALQGCNLNLTYYTLNDPSLTAISKTSNGVSQVLEMTGYVKPVLSNGDANTFVTIALLCRRPQQLLMQQ